MDLESDFFAIEAEYVPFLRKNEIEIRGNLPKPVFHSLENCHKKMTYVRPESYIMYTEPTPEEEDDRVDYDLDSEDEDFLEKINEKLETEKLSIESFEKLIDLFEKASFVRNGYHSSSTVVDDLLLELDHECVVCGNGESQDSNQIVYCDGDGCDVMVHQDCYGIQYIPEGNWFCKACEIGPGSPNDLPLVCAICNHSSKSVSEFGSEAFWKSTDDKWIHLICALWTPECCNSFVKGVGGNYFLDTVCISNINPLRYSKLNCRICKNTRSGACIQCSNPTCGNSFHAICAKHRKGYILTMLCQEDGYEYYKAYCPKHGPRNENEIVLFEKSKKADNMLKKKEKESQSVNEENLKILSSSGKDTTKSKDTLADSFGVDLEKLISNSNSSPPSPSQPSLQFSKEVWENAFEYWILKRRKRNGLSLLRKYQPNALTSLVRKHSLMLKKNKKGRKNNLKSYLLIRKKLRVELDYARNLLSMVKTREKLKLRRIESANKMFFALFLPAARFFLLLVDCLENIIFSNNTDVNLNEKNHISKQLDVFREHVFDRNISHVNSYSFDFFSQEYSCVCKDLVDNILDLKITSFLNLVREKAIRHNFVLFSEDLILLLFQKIIFKVFGKLSPCKNEVHHHHHQAQQQEEEEEEEEEEENETTAETIFDLIDDDDTGHQLFFGNLPNLNYDGIQKKKLRADKKNLKKLSKKSKNNDLLNGRQKIKKKKNKMMIKKKMKMKMKVRNKNKSIIVDLSGMSVFEKCNSILKILTGFDKSGYFFHSVTEKDAPDYTDFIDNPMSFEVMQSKIADYLSVLDFVDDFHLICDNAMLYNPRSSIYWRSAHSLKKKGDDLIIKLLGSQMNIKLKILLQILKGLDEQMLFYHPVSIKEVPDYYEIIKSPMSFDEMDRKIPEYVLEEINGEKRFLDDFRLICDNATVYNDKDSYFYKAAAALKSNGDEEINQFMRKYEKFFKQS